ncbi:hypothetical protein SAMN05660653_01755 [Desulfonatronum thiosulfatophilum]|uniref:Uncharacterized protein n=2 Tax=Desulfonatronum thiosulfatophilum TaxID=617002 RepID=A0A1G6CVJ4_9BACT|nr:hypothetical protein SAMN05660653_01755 [Desulfonatronum thiosulfatophilum]
MEKRYLLRKCGSGSKSMPIDCFTANGMAEANEAVKWLRQHHPERQDLQLETGEFFELLEQGHCPPEEWEADLAELARKRKQTLP